MYFFFHHEFINEIKNKQIQQQQKNKNKKQKTKNKQNKHALAVRTPQFQNIIRR